MSFWGSPDLSPGIEKLFNAMKLCENSKSLIICINLCNIKNMILLSNLELDELSNLFSRRDYVIAEHMIPTTFNEETEFLSDSNLNSFKRHYMTFYWKVHKDFLDYIENSMAHDSLIGSTISTKKCFLRQ
jgi:hypothetical protein